MKRHMQIVSEAEQKLAALQKEKEKVKLLLNLSYPSIIAYSQKDHLGIINIIA